jgi:hypothetical protein
VLRSHLCDVHVNRSAGGLMSLGWELDVDTCGASGRVPSLDYGADYHGARTKGNGLEQRCLG